MPNPITSVRGTLNQIFERNGLPKFDNPGQMIAWLAGQITDHDHLKSILLSCEPEKRQRMYEGMRPHLRFLPKPLDHYLSEAAMEAEARQLPRWDAETQTFIPYTPPAIGQTKFEKHAEQCITDSLNIAKSKGNFLTLKCARCTKKSTFSGATKVDAVISARKKGWFYQKTEEREEEICPKCSAKRSLINPEVGRA